LHAKDLRQRAAAAGGDDPLYGEEALGDGHSCREAT